MRKCDLVRKRALTILSVSLAVLAIVLAACSKDECLENKTTLPKAAFYDSAFPDSKLKLDSTAIYAQGAPKGDFILDSLKSAAGVTIPFDLEANKTVFVVEYARQELRKAGVKDYITLQYSRTPYFVSSACGVSYRLMVEDCTYTRNLIDSVTVPVPLISNVDSQNIRIYFRVAHPEPAEPEDEVSTEE